MLWKHGIKDLRASTYVILCMNSGILEMGCGNDEFLLKFLGAENIYMKKLDY